MCDAQGSQDLGDQLRESEVAAWCGGHLNQEAGRRNIKKEPPPGSWHWVPEAHVETGMARSWPPGGFSGWGWVCVLAVHALLPVSKLACFSLWLGFPSHSDPGWGQTEPPCGPTTVVKQRMQMYNSPHQSALSCIRTVWGTEGVGAFYRSYTTQLTMNIPFQSIHFITYEFLQEQINPYRGYNPQSHIISGGLAGALAAAATTPLDVCKTLLNTQENMALNLANISGRLSGMANAFRTVYQLNGLPGYFKGVQARVIYQMPSTAISWSVYEFFKYFLTKHKLESRTPY